MSAEVRGWCPTAWQPMAAGDGLLLRLRPRLARLTPAQLRTIADIACTHGNGQIDVTNRAALQLRGLDAHGWRRALDRLVAAGLVDPNPVREARVVLVAPDWRSGDDTHRIATALHRRLDALPPLPGKIGIAIDAGSATVLHDDPADFRIERGAHGAAILRAEGRATGVPLDAGREVDALLALVTWFVASGGVAAGRMARHHAPLPGWATGDAVPARCRAIDMPATRLRFGRIDADALAAIAGHPGVTGVRLTPWRALLFEGAAPAAPTDVFDPARAVVDACVGAPACPQATVATRALAARLEPFVRGSLHVSGCAKGCARAAPADVVLTGRGGRFDLARHARADAAPSRRDLSPADVIALFESPPRAP